MDFFKKYLKYKEKYINLKSQLGSGKRGRVDEEPYVKSCYLILEDISGNTFMGSSGPLVTSSDRYMSIHFKEKDNETKKTIAMLLEEIHKRVKDNDKLTLPPEELSKFSFKFGSDRRMKLTFDEFIKENGIDPIAPITPTQLSPVVGVDQPRIVTRPRIFREKIFTDVLVMIPPNPKEAYPKGYHYVIDNGVKVKIIKQPNFPTFFYKYLGGERDFKSGESTDECLKREVEEEGNFQIDKLCVNWRDEPKPEKPENPTVNTLYVDTNKSNENPKHKYYYLKISDELKPALLEAYRRITIQQATEFFFGAFRPRQ